MRIKPDSPPILDGKPAKYLSPKSSPNRLYVPSGVETLFNDAAVPLYISEGEKKALKAAQEGLKCIAIAGVWCWKGKGSNGPSEPIPDLDLIKGRGELSTSSSIRTHSEN